MAASRCVRSFLRPATRVQAPKSFSTSRAVRAKDGEGNPEMFPEDMSLEERLKILNIDPAEYQKLYKSKQKVEQEFAKWEPKTAVEAQRRWEEAKDTPDHLTLLHIYKRAGIEPIKLAKERNVEHPDGEPNPLDPTTLKGLSALRSPINVQAVNMRPLRRAPEHGIPVCDLQLRTYSIRNLLLFADFAMRAAYYMGLPAKGPIPLPRITERWTVPRANFIFKKSQENFERITMRRLIQIQDGHPDVVKAWLAFLQEHQYYGVGMKANIWEYESLDAATNVGVEIKEGDFEGRREQPMLEKVRDILESDGYRESMKGWKGPEGVEVRQ